MKTIGFAAQFGNGKDLAADYLASRLNDEAVWVRDAFANLVKDTFCMITGTTRAFIEEWKRKEEIPPGFALPLRDCLMLIGDGFRKMKPNIWIENVFRNQKHNQIIADVRYINETNYIRNKNGISILLWRPNHENNINNASEQEFMPFINRLKKLNFDGPIPKELEIPFNIWLRNDGTKEDLYNKIDTIVIPYLKEFWE